MDRDLLVAWLLTISMVVFVVWDLVKSGPNPTTIIGTIFIVLAIMGNIRLMRLDKKIGELVNRFQDSNK